MTDTTVVNRRWSLIASQLERRTDNDVKNHWNTKLKKHLAAAAAPFSSRPEPALLLPPPVTTAHQSSSSSLLPLAAPAVKAEAYAYDGDFLAPAAALQDPFMAAEGSTSASLSAASSGSNWSTVDNSVADGGSGGFFADFCTAAGSASDLAAADQFLSGFYYPLDQNLSLV
jgi:myb proto-oncogene protein